MSFTNILVDTTELPRAEELTWTRMPPAHRKELLAQSAIVLTVIVIGATAVAVLFPYPPELAWLFARALPALMVMIGLFTTLLTLARIRLKGYALRSHDIAYRSGLFWRKTTLLPFNRIQHVEVSSGPLQRRFGLSTLKFFTAGGRSVDLKIEGLLSTDAERLRTHILERSKPGAKSG